MQEQRPFASLSSTLLARKGQAKPAMRPQGFSQHNVYDDLGWNDMGIPPSRPSVAEAGPDSIQEELPPVVQQQAAIAEELNAHVEMIDPVEPAPIADELPVFVEPEPEPLPIAVPVVKVKAPALTPATKTPVTRARAGEKGKAAFTLRLDPDRHLKLRLACAIDHRSAQTLVIDALDRFLAAIPELESLAAHARHR